MEYEALVQHAGIIFTTTVDQKTVVLGQFRVVRQFHADRGWARIPASRKSNEMRVCLVRGIHHPGCVVVEEELGSRESLAPLRVGYFESVHINNV